MPNQTQQTNPSLDPDVVNLAKAIRQSESGGKMIYGASGEYGAYQFTRDTWNATAPKYGINTPLEKSTLEEQNAVAYNRIKEWKNQGKDVTQIASMWNAGEGEPNAYTGKFSNGSPSISDPNNPSSLNKQGVSFNVPAYVTSVVKAYQALKAGGQVQSDPNNPSNAVTSTTPIPAPSAASSVDPSAASTIGASLPGITGNIQSVNGYTPPIPPSQIPTNGASGVNIPGVQGYAPPTPPVQTSMPVDSGGSPQEEGLLAKLGRQLGGRFKDIGSNLSDLTLQIQGQKGSQNWWSDLLQIAGAGAGGLGDVINTGLEVIPGVKQVEGLIGSGINKAADTQVGQSVVKAIQDFQQQNPELAKDIGAGLNIVTAIPIFRGLRAVGDIAGSGLGAALGQLGEKVIEKDLTAMAQTTKAGLKFVENNPEVIANIAKERLPLDIIDGKLSTASANEEIWNRVKGLNSQIAPILAKPEYATVGSDGLSIANDALTGYVDRFGKNIPGLPYAEMSPSELIDNARSLDSLHKGLWNKFEAGQANLQEVNRLRSSLDEKVAKVFTDDPNVSTSKELGAQLASAMRNYVQTIAPETQPLFQEMTRLSDINEAFKPNILEGKRVQSSALRKLIQRGIGAGAGVGVAKVFGGGMVPELLSGFLGEQSAGLLGKKEVGGILGRLYQTLPERIGRLSQAPKRLGGLVGASLAQKATTKKGGGYGQP